jgi:hypothetical protein
MSDDYISNPQPALGARIADGASEAIRAGSEIAAAVSAVAGRVNRLIDDARAPGQPLDTLSNLTRKAPLGCLCLAFLLGMATVRRR